MQATDKAKREAQRAAALEPTGQYLPVLYVAPAEIVRNLPAIHTASQETAEAEPVRYLPVLYIKPKKIRKPRAKKNKEPKENPDIWRTIRHEARENVAPSRDGARKIQNDYKCDIRMSFCDYVESLRRDGQIS